MAPLDDADLGALGVGQAGADQPRATIQNLAIVLAFSQSKVRLQGAVGILAG